MVGEHQTAEQRKPVFLTPSDREFMSLTTEKCKALNVGEFQLVYPMTPAGPTFYGLPVRKLPTDYLPDRFFANFYEMLKPPVTVYMVPQLRTLMAGLFSGNPAKFDTSKINKVM